MTVKFYFQNKVSSVQKVPSVFCNFICFAIRGKKLYILINYCGSYVVITCSTGPGLLMVHGLQGCIPENDCKLDNAHLVIKNTDVRHLRLPQNIGVVNWTTPCAPNKSLIFDPERCLKELTWNLDQKCTFENFESGPKLQSGI